MTLVHLASVAMTLILILAPGLHGVWVRVSRVYGVYFFIAFALRGFLLAQWEPAPERDRSFAIAVLASAGYDVSLSLLLPLAIMASAGIYFALLVVSRLGIRREITFSMHRSSATTLFVVGASLRLISEVQPDVADLGRLGSLGQAICVIVLAGTMLGTDWRVDGRRWVIFAASAEAAFAFVSASKTPLLTVLLLLYLDPRRSRLRLRDIALGSAAVVVAFIGVQALKPAATAQSGDNILSVVFFAVTGRLDGLYALSGAWARGPGLYSPPGGFVESLFSGLIPGYLQPEPKLLAGAQWGIGVYGVDTGTSYAEGLAAEGLAVVGYSGPLIWGVLGGTVVSLMLKCATLRARPLQYVGLAFIASTVPFERGLLGQFEQIGAAAQAALLVWVATLFLDALLGRAKTSPKAQPSGRTLQEASSGSARSLRTATSRPVGPPPATTGYEPPRAVEI